MINEIDINNFINDITLEHQEWRLKELAYIKTISIKLTKEEEKFFLNSSMSMIYSHWEGFVKKLIKELFNYIDSFNIKYAELNDNLILFSLESHIDNLIKSTDFNKKVKYTNKIIEESKGNMSLKNKEINVKSNLKDKILQEILDQIGLTKSYYSDNELKSLKDFVNLRNAISHGDQNSIVLNLGKIEQYIKLITKLMDNLILSIQNYLREKKYLKVYDSSNVELKSVP